MAPARQRVANPLRQYQPCFETKRIMKQLRPAILILLLLLVWPAGAGQARALPRGVVSGDLVIKLKPGSSLTAEARATGPHAGMLNTLLRRAGAGVAQELGRDSNTYRIRVGFNA